MLKAFCPQGNGGKGDYKVRMSQGVSEMGMPVCPCCEGKYQDAIRKALTDDIAGLKQKPDTINFDIIAEPFRLILE